MESRILSKSLKISCAVLALVLNASPVSAIVYAPKSLTQLCTESAQIVHAKVTAAAQRKFDNVDAPITCYSLKPLAQVKSTAKPVNEVCYVGGQLGDAQLQIAGLRYPQVGEELIFFVRDTEPRPSVSPTVGVNQGIFLIKEGKVNLHTEQKICSVKLPTHRTGKKKTAVGESDMRIEQDGKSCDGVEVKQFLKALSSCKKF